MKEKELRELYNEAYRIIYKERVMRQAVFRKDETRRAEKLAEIDRLLAILTRFKDEIKASTQEQMPLIEMPAKYD